MKLNSLMITSRPRAWIRALVPALALLVGGCRQNTAQPVSNSPAPAATALTNVAEPARTARVFDQDVPTKPNARLPTLRLFVGAHELQAELALTELQIRTGMMFRTNILENEAMLFVFPFTHQAGFWMKNVDVPLSCAYIDPEGVILETHDMTPHEVAPITSATDRVQYVLETKQGWFERHDIKPGVLILTERGTLRETFFKSAGP